MLLVALLALLASGLIAPFITAGRFSGVIRNALERTLGRKVEFDSAHFDLFSGPGFSLKGVTISEDPRFGIEPFAYVPTLQARLRLDQLLAGKIQFASLRLVDPSLNLVKNAAGDWNVVTLMDRVSSPGRAPFDLFPLFAVSNGRVNFKFGARKTTLYLQGSDLSVYPERKGKLYLAFSGSPARTDRAGMGFGHFRGSVNWFVADSPRGPSRLQAEINLDPSNLSELTTLIEGHDIGIHGTVSSHLQFEGPATDLKVAGQFRLQDVHRWDLLPSSGEAWAVRLAGSLDLLTHRLELKTAPLASGQPPPVVIRLLANDFLAHPAASVAAEFKDAPLRDLLPLARRMGVPVPAEADLRGALTGAVSYSRSEGWLGGFVLNDAEASLDGSPVLRSAAVNLTAAGDRLRFGPSIIEAGTGGTLRMSGSFSFPDRQTTASLLCTDVSAKALKKVTAAWLEAPAALDALSEGDLTGQLAYSKNPDDVTAAGPFWSGQFDFSNGTVAVPGLSLPLRNSQGHVNFNESSFELEHLTARLGERKLKARYRYNRLAKYAEQVRIEFPTADLAELEAALNAPASSESLWSRLRFFRRAFPAWLSARNLEGDLKVDQLLVNQAPAGTLNARFVWLGTHLDINDATLKLPQGLVSASGQVDLASFIPRWQFSAQAASYPWAGGLLDAEGVVSSTGAGQDLLRNLVAQGSFTGERLAIAPESTLENASGRFDFSLAEGWPSLRLSEIQAIQDGEAWSGEGNTESDGKLLLNLSHEGRQMHLVGSLSGQAGPLSVIPKPDAPVSLPDKLKF